MTLFKAESTSIRYTGRWSITESMAVTTAPGGMIEIGFKGKLVILHFDITTNQHPYPHLWVKVDNGAKIEVPLDRFIRIETEAEENHIVTVIFKGAVEMQHRWYPPLIGKVSFCGFEAEKEGTLPDDLRKTIEFIGDSITEGVLIDEDYKADSSDQPNRVYQDDVTATYAYKTALALNLKPVIMGYGATGITRSGQGAVPRVSEGYPFYYHNVPIESHNADYIVINHGTNDRRATTEDYILGMEEFLKLVRKRNPLSKIAVMIPFYGSFHDELIAFIPEFNRKYNDSVLLIDTKGWLPQLPLHPDRDGHMIASEKLVGVLKTWI